jgi:hypothetical protein
MREETVITPVHMRKQLGANKLEPGTPPDETKKELDGEKA